MQYREWTTTLIDDEKGKTSGTRESWMKFIRNFILSPLILELIALNAIDYNGNLWPHTQLLTAINLGDWTESHVGILTSGEMYKQCFPTTYASASDSWTMMENHSAQQGVPSLVSLYVIQPINYKQEVWREICLKVKDKFKDLRWL